VIFKNLLEEIYPIKCLICGERSSEYLCPSCRSEIKNFESRTHFFTSEFGDTIYYYGKYTAGVGILVRGLKYSKKVPAGRIIAEFLSEIILKKFNPKPSLIVPVPMSMNKLLSRRENQCEIIGKEISELTEIRLEVNLIKRKFNLFEKDQVKLERAERKENLKNSFYVAKKDLPVTSIILLDDVATTGRTINVCKNLLLNSFPNLKIYPLVFAH